MSMPYLRAQSVTANHEYAVSTCRSHVTIYYRCYLSIIFGVPYSIYISFLIIVYGIPYTEFRDAAALRTPRRTPTSCDEETPFTTHARSAQPWHVITKVERSGSRTPDLLVPLCSRFGCSTWPHVPPSRPTRSLRALAPLAPSFRRVSAMCSWTAPRRRAKLPTITCHMPTHPMSPAPRYPPGKPPPPPESRLS